MPDAPPTPAPRSGVVSCLVGLFALWQLAVIPLINLFEFVPLRPTQYDIDPPIETAQRWGRFTEVEWMQQSAEGAGCFLAAWTEATGQDQGWLTFTPGFPPHTVVLVAEFHFPDGSTDRLYSRFEPPDLANPGPRWPLIDDREFNFEANIFMLAWECDPKTLVERPEQWRRLPEKIRENEWLVTAWLKWQAQRYRTIHPDRPEPTGVVLILRYIPTPAPGEPPDWTQRPVFERPFARWQPRERHEPGYLPIEGYDPVANQYVRLKAWVRP